MGGLGNQMFQYAFALSLKEKFPKEEILIDITHYGHIFFKRYKGANLHNGFEVENVFSNATLKHATPWQLMKVTWYMPNYVLSRVLRRIMPKRKTELIQKEIEYFAHKEEYYEHEGDCYYEGIWESVKNYLPIRNLLKYVYAHGKPDEINQRYIDSMEMENSVGVHIRRGDYLYVKEFYGISDIDYYERGIAEILRDGKKHVFYIFSNDIKWCEENIVPLCKGHEVIMVKGNTGKKSCWDMHLMTHCKDLIIANSSFSWWGAFLNDRNGRVIAPKTWVNRNAEFDIWLDDWVKL